MKRLLLVAAMLVLFAGCGETVEVPVTVPVRETVPVTVEVPATVQMPVTVQMIITATPLPRPTATPRPTEPPPPDVGTRGAPVPFGEEFGLTLGVVKKFYMSITEAYRGEEAWARIYEANQFNDPPPEGMEYVLLYVNIRYDEGPGDDPLQLNEFDFEMVSKGQVVDTPSVVDPDPQFDITFFPGAEGGGWVVFVAYEDDPDPVLVIGMEYDGTGGFFFATHP